MSVCSLLCEPRLTSIINNKRIASQEIWRSRSYQHLTALGVQRGGQARTETGGWLHGTHSPEASTPTSGIARIASGTVNFKDLSIRGESRGTLTPASAAFLRGRAKLNPAASCCSGPPAADDPDEGDDDDRHSEDSTNKSERRQGGGPGDGGCRLQRGTQLCVPEGKSGNRL